MKEIHLTRGKVVLVDDEDFDRVNQFKWYAHQSWTGKTWYARRTCLTAGGKRIWIRLHQFLLPNAKRVDHRNGNGLDCQKQNLRPATRSQNQWNRHKQAGSSKFKGVCWHRSSRKWTAGIMVEGVKKYLGVFTSEIDAAHTYDLAARELFGEFARLNFPGGAN